MSAASSTLTTDAVANAIAAAVATALRGSSRDPELPAYLRLPEVLQLVRFSKMHLSRLEKAGKFPRRIRFGSSRVVWDRNEVLAWLAARRAESRG